MTNRIAILTDPNDPYPPSDISTLFYFKKMAKERGINLEFLVYEDIHKLHAFDGLFVRCTTNINNATFQWIQYGESLGLNMLDSLRGIALGSDKYLQYLLLNNNNIATPQTIVLYPNSDVQELVNTHNLTYPLVLKVVNGYFSQGVSQVQNLSELNNKCKILFSSGHHCLILQAYMPTDYDWRIGILNNEIIFASKYHMSPNHWQIVKYSENNIIESEGDGESIPTYSVPFPIIESAKKVACLLDHALYGLDIKLIDGKAYLIEINDNPNFNYGMEDMTNRDEIYNKIIDILVQNKHVHKKIADHKKLVIEK